MKRKKSGAALVIAILAITVTVSVLYTVEKAIRPALLTVAEAAAVNAAQRAVDNAVVYAGENGLDYSSIIAVEHTSDGSLSAIKTDIYTINTVKSTLSLSILENISALERNRITIPLGTVFGSGLFYGSGPDIPVKIIPVGSVLTDIKSTFYSAGINQTVHRIIMTVNVSLKIVLPTVTLDESFTTDVTLAETVLIGTVPEYYMQLPQSLFSQNTE